MSAKFRDQYHIEIEVSPKRGNGVIAFLSGKRQVNGMVFEPPRQVPRLRLHQPGNEDP